MEYDLIQRECVINGKIVHYDFMGNAKNVYQDSKLHIQYLGYGEVYSINGKKQRRRVFGHFWQKKVAPISSKKQRLVIIKSLRKRFGFKNP